MAVVDFLCLVHSGFHSHLPDVPITNVYVCVCGGGVSQKQKGRERGSRLQYSMASVGTLLKTEQIRERVFSKTNE